MAWAVAAMPDANEGSTAAGGDGPSFRAEQTWEPGNGQAWLATFGPA